MTVSIQHLDIPDLTNIGNDVYQSSIKQDNNTSYYVELFKKLHDNVFELLNIIYIDGEEQYKIDRKIFNLGTYFFQVEGYINNLLSYDAMKTCDISFQELIKIEKQLKELNINLPKVQTFIQSKTLKDDYKKNEILYDEFLTIKIKK